MHASLPFVQFSSGLPIHHWTNTATDSIDLVLRGPGIICCDTVFGHRTSDECFHMSLYTPVRGYCHRWIWTGCWASQSTRYVLPAPPPPQCEVICLLEPPIHLCNGVWLRPSLETIRPATVPSCFSRSAFHLLCQRWYGCGLWPRQHRWDYSTWRWYNSDSGSMS